MTAWKKHYDEHLVSVEEAAKQIKPGDAVWLGHGPEIPYTLLDELHANMEDYHDVTLLYNIAVVPFKLLFDYESKKHFRLISFLTTA